MQNNSMQIELPPNLLEGTIKKFRNFVANTRTPTPWLTQLLVLGKSRVNQKLC